MYLCSIDTVIQMCPVILKSTITHLKRLINLTECDIFCAFYFYCKSRRIDRALEIFSSAIHSSLVFLDIFKITFILFDFG